MRGVEGIFDGSAIRALNPLVLKELADILPPRPFPGQNNKFVIMRLLLVLPSSVCAYGLKSPLKSPPVSPKVGSPSRSKCEVQDCVREAESIDYLQLWSEMTNRLYAFSYNCRTTRLMNKRK